MKKSLIAVLVVIGLAGAGGAAWGESLEPGTVFQDCPECPEVVVIPPGEFMMGSPDSESERGDDEGPVHRVTIPSAFAVGKYEVTYEEWDACVSAGGCTHSPLKNDKDGWGRGRKPVSHISWDDTQEYVSWLSTKTGKTYRLLSESEWEYVARAGTTTPYHTGDTISLLEANFNTSGPVLVGSFGANQFGLHDVFGNVSEWVQDCLKIEYNLFSSKGGCKMCTSDYTGAPSDGTAWINGICSPDMKDMTLRGVRGGSFFVFSKSDEGAAAARSASRFTGSPNKRNKLRGFRVARTLP